MKRTILTIIAFLIVIGVFGLAINTTFGYETMTYITKEQVPYYTTKFYIWKIDFWKYINNLQLAVTNVSILRFNTPTRTWINQMDWQALGNNLQVILDYIILTINLLLYPLKIGAYISNNLIAILGINTDITNINNGLAWFVFFVRDFLLFIEIPYI